MRGATIPEDGWMRREIRWRVAAYARTFALASLFGKGGRGYLAGADIPLQVQVQVRLRLRLRKGHEDTSTNYE